MLQQKITVIIVLFNISFFSINAEAANAKGKPFVALQDQIVEVQGAVTTLEDQVEDLIGRVDSIAQRLVATESAISELNEENDSLNTLIMGAYTSIEDIYLQIDYLNDDLILNSSLISALQGAIASIEDGQIDLTSNLQDQIDNNLELIELLEGDISSINDYILMDSHISEGTCPEGEYVIGHTVNSVSCAPVEGSGSSTVTGYFTYARSATWGRNMQAYCYLPTDIRTGGGFNAIQSTHTVRRSTPTGVNGWTVELSGNFRDIQVYVMCLRVN